jgi:hypothetical protein
LIIAQNTKEIKAADHDIAQDGSHYPGLSTRDENILQENSMGGRIESSAQVV